MFKIGQSVKIKSTNEIGEITDKMSSEAKGLFVYIIKLEDGRSVIRDEHKLEPTRKQAEYKVETEIADNVVIGIIYEVTEGKKIEVCRGHAHIIHNGAEGIAQACSYAYRRAFESIDTGIYMKQRRGNENER